MFGHTLLSCTPKGYVRYFDQEGESWSAGMEFVGPHSEDKVINKCSAPLGTHLRQSRWFLVKLFE